MRRPLGKWPLDRHSQAGRQGTAFKPLRKESAASAIYLELGAQFTSPKPKLPASSDESADPIAAIEFDRAFIGLDAGFRKQWRCSRSESDVLAMRKGIGDEISSRRFRRQMLRRFF